MPLCLCLRWLTGFTPTIQPWVLWGGLQEKGLRTEPGKVRGLPHPSQTEPLGESPSRSSRLISQFVYTPPHSSWGLREAQLMW